MRVVDVGQRTTQWHEWRRGGVSASNAAVILGSSPFKTPWRLWGEIRGVLPVDDLSKNPWVRHGIVHEPYARQWFEEEYDTIALPICAESSVNSIIRASFDGIQHQGRPLEIKCPSTSNFEDVVVNRMASKGYRLYYPQVQHQIAVAGADMGYLVFYHPSHSPVVFEIQREDSFIDMMLDRELDFWEMVQTGKAPPKDPERDHYTPEDAVRVQWAMFADQLKRVDADLVRSMQTVKVCKEQRETIRDELVALMGGYVSAKADGISITRYIQDGSIDWKAVAMQFDPDLSDEKYGAYRKAGGGRVRLTVDTDATTDSASLDEVLDEMRGGIWF